MLPLAGIAAEAAPFAKSLYPVFEEPGCRGCHNPDGVASATRLQFPEQGAPADRIEAFGNSLVILVDARTPTTPCSSAGPRARIPHSGGQRIQPGSPEEVSDPPAEPGAFINLGPLKAANGVADAAPITCEPHKRLLRGR